MEIESFKEKNVVMIRISGRMDASNASDFEKECTKWVQEGEDSLLVNLEDLEYISSAGLRSILAAGKKLKAQGGALVLCNLNGMVEEVFTISGFSSIFSVYDTVEAALEDL